MEQWQRDHIRKNLPQLLKDTTCEPYFLELLNAEGVICQSDIEILASLRSEFEKSARFYKLIQTRTNAYQALTNALRETSQTGPADLLEKANAGQAPANKGPTSSSVVHSPPYTTGEGGLSVPTVNILPATPPQPAAPIAMGNPSWDSAGSAPPPPVGHDSVDFLNNIQPLSISVTKPQDRMAFADDQYGLREDFKGYALVLNITEFNNDKMNRAGAQKDTTYMAQLWAALGYKVTVHEGSFTFLQVRSILENFASQFKQDPSARSCVVFFGSHGSYSKIESSDHKSIDLYQDLIYKFDSSQCKQLQGKPKIFIIQACQRFQSDDAVPDRTQVDQMLQTPIDDTIVCFGTIPGYVANRDVYLGTWYTYCLTKVFMEEAHNTHLLGLLKKTQETMRNINAQAPQGQLSAYMDLGIKTLYFNMYP